MNKSSIEFIKSILLFEIIVPQGTRPRPTPFFNVPLSMQEGVS